MRKRINSSEIVAALMLFLSLTPVPATAQVADQVVPLSNEPTPTTTETKAPSEPASFSTQTASSATGARRRPLARPTGNNVQPLYFAPEDNGISFTSPQLKWEISKGTRLNLGGLIFSTSSLRIAFNQLRRADVPRRYHESELSTNKTTNISFIWPQLMTQTGQLTLESPQGKVLWQMDISDKNRADWKDLLQADRDKLLKVHAKSGFGLLDIDPDKTPFLKNGTIFRFCLSKATSEAERIKLCSNLNRVRRNGESIRLTSLSEKKNPSLFIDQKSAGPRGSVNFPPDKNVDIRIVFANGATITASSRPLNLKFLDVVKSDDGKSVILTGRGPKPLGKVKDIVVPATHFWSETGVAKEVVWETIVPIGRPTIRVLGAWSVPFTLLISFDALPRAADRVYVTSLKGSGTYNADSRIRIAAPSGALISGDKKSSVTKAGSKEFFWKFPAKRHGQFNVSQITVEEPDSRRNWVAKYEMYRGYPYEFSSRLTGIIAGQESVILGEIAASAWFDRAFNLESYYLSDRRWGISARYFQALTTLAISESDLQLDRFSATNIDLKYNLLPGIWNRDELLGLVLSAEMVNIGGWKANLAGSGVFWARTMPKIFNDLFNLVPFFRYPKYVDMEFIYFPLSFSNTIIPGASYLLNFHGKVFWTPRIYGEAGFGLKQFQYQLTSESSELSITTAYGTFGLGIVF